MNPQSKSDTFTLQDNDKKKESYNCDLDWNSSITPALIPSVVAFPIGVGVTLTSLFIDYSKNNYYTCSNQLLKFENGDSPKKKYPVRILILPTRGYQSFGLEDELHTIREKFRNYMFVDYGISSKEFSFFGIDETRSWTPEEIRPEIINKLSLAYSATHLLYLTPIDSSFRIFQLKIEDIYTKKTVYETQIKIQGEANSLSQQMKTLATKFFYFRPNALSVGKTSYEITFEGKNYSQEKYPNRFPAYLSMWNIERVSSPYLFQTWDYEFRAKPSLSFPAFRLQAHDSGTPSYNMRGIQLDYTVGINMHTPIGAIGIDLGPSFVYLDKASEVEGGGGQNAFANKVSTSYIAFFTRRFFLKTEISYLTFGGGGERIDDGLAIQSIKSLSSNIGYYLPETFDFL